MDDILSEFWRQARAIRLTPEESAHIRRNIVNAGENPVRAVDTYCLQEYMDPRHILSAARSIRLSPEESVKVEHAVLRHMVAHPVRTSPHRSNMWDALHSLAFSLRPIPVTSIIAAIVVSLTMSLSVAAESALPGEFLYPIKVHVNERVESVLHFSDDSHAKFEAERLESRLEEAAQLAASGRLHGTTKTEVSAGISSQLQRIQSLAQRLADNGKANAALDVHSQVESDLIANAAVLDALTETADVAKDDVRDLLQNVSTAERAAKRSRTASEAAVSGSAQTDARASAKGAIQAATNVIEEVRTFIDRRGSAADPQILVQANARFAHSKKILSGARQKFNAEQFGESFRMSKEAQRTAQEAKVMLKVSAVVQKRLSSAAAKNKPASATSSVPASSSSVDTSNDLGAGVNVQGNVMTPPVEVNLQKNGEGKVDIGL